MDEPAPAARPEIDRVGQQDAAAIPSAADPGPASVVGAAANPPAPAKIGPRRAGR
jgi:hypothetical protein